VHARMIGLARYDTENNETANCASKGWRILRGSSQRAKGSNALQSDS